MNSTMFNKEKTQFSLRTLLVSTGLLSISLAFLTVAIRVPSNAIAFLASVVIVLSLLSTAATSILRAKSPQGTLLLGILFATIAGIACSFFVIAFEWHGEDNPSWRPAHPWPAEDWLYIATAIARCGLLGSVIGYTVVAVLVVTISDLRCFAKQRIVHAVAGCQFIALIILWWPVLPTYLETWSVNRLIFAIEAANTDEIEISTRVDSVQFWRAEREAVSILPYRALEGENVHVRLCALEALKLMKDTATEMGILEHTLIEMQKDANKSVREAASRIHTILGR